VIRTALLLIAVALAGCAVPATVPSSTRTEVRFTIPVGAVTGKITRPTADRTATSATSLTVTP
jgi:hypothetical protein